MQNDQWARCFSDENFQIPSYFQLRPFLIKIPNIQIKLRKVEQIGIN